ncbi:MAG: hypothetical protein ACI91O_000661 [Candidatus Poriferisodalaceae bacterium]|jgi:hypothetical protein
MAASGNTVAVTEHVPAVFSEFDVALWTLDHEETLGTKPERWLLDPTTGIPWLMKDVTFHRVAGRLSRKGDDWAERIASEVARCLELPTARVELADGGHGNTTSLGIVSKSMLSDSESLIHGNELFADVGISGSSPHDRTGYNLSRVRLALESAELPGGADDPSPWEYLVGYLSLDALIGNTDRHQENWAVIADGAGARRLAPTFDHASSLGFQLDDDQRLERLSTSDEGPTPEAYAERARTKFEQSPSTMQVAIQALETLPAHRRDMWLDRCGDIEGLVSAIEQVPAHPMSLPARDFAERSMRSNHKRLVSHRMGTV